MRSNQARVEFAEDAVAPRARPEIRAVAAGKVENVMDPRVYKVALGCWIGFLSVFWVTFWINASALFMVVVGTVYAAVFFGVPYAMSRQVRERPAADRPTRPLLRRPVCSAMRRASSAGHRG